jgi:hypothetical protein
MPGKDKAQSSNPIAAKKKKKKKKKKFQDQMKVVTQHSRTCGIQQK